MSEPENEERDGPGEALLARMGALVRADESVEHGDAWARFAAGELDGAGLRAVLGADVDVDGLAHGRELFAPRDSGLATERLLRALDAAPGRTRDSEQRPGASRGEPLDVRSRGRSTRIVGVLLAIAAAVVAVLWLRAAMLDPGSSRRDSAMAATLPHYVLETDGGSSVVRSSAGHRDAGEPLRYAPGDRFVWVLRPEQAGEQSPSLRVFAIPADSPPERPVKALGLGSAMEAGGASLRISGVVELLGLSQGPWTLGLILAPDRDDLPTSLSLRTLDDLGGDPAGALQVFRLEIVLGD